MNPHKSAREIRILPGRELVLGLPCMSCEHRASAELRRPEAINILRRVLAYTNFAGASESEIKDASVVIQRAGSAEEVVAGASIGSPTLGSIPHLNGVALEIALNEAHERSQLERALRQLDAEWQQAEQMPRLSMMS